LWQQSSLYTRKLCNTVNPLLASISPLKLTPSQQACTEYVLIRFNLLSYMHSTSQARVFYFRTALQQRAQVKDPGLRGWHALRRIKFARRWWKFP
jgi:hypothetical protein